MTKLWLCEKPKQGTVVAGQLGILKRHNGYIETKDGIVTWCFGHLLGFKQPGEYDEKWKTWALESLPIVPDSFDLVPLKGKEKQLKIIGGLLKNTDHLMLATDGDREGELLGREVLDYFNWSGKIERMWNTSLDEESIDNALADIRPGKDTENLYIAGAARAKADYINGMTMTRAATKAFGNGSDIYSVGRVQTAVLGIIVRRAKEIENFISKEYFELFSCHEKQGKEFKLRYAPKAENRIFDKEKANHLLDLIKNKTVDFCVEQKRKKTKPPKLFSLLTLQKTANTALGWSASETKAVAQELYDAQLISYPRTDCEYLPNEQEKDAEKILAHLAGIDSLKPFIQSIETIVYRKSTFNTGKTTAHHAIVPTKKSAKIEDLSKKQASLYMIICQRYIANFMVDYEYDSTIIKYLIEECEFKGVGNTPAINGWKEMYQGTPNDDSEPQDVDNQSFPNIENGELGCLDQVDLQELKTKPPARFTQNSLSDAMANITSLIEDEALIKEFKQRLKNDDEVGIGTPATRDTYIDILIQRSYVTLDKKKIIETDLGVKLIDALPDTQSDPVETAIMESMLNEIAQGNADKTVFIDIVINNTTEYVHEIKESAKTFVKEAIKNPCPKCDEGQMMRRKGTNGFFWGCSNYPTCEHSMLDKKGSPVERVAPVISDVCCELCGKPMALRPSSKKGSSGFWGCTDFPTCKNTLPDDNGKPGKKAVVDESAKECPTCKKGKLVERVTKKGKNKGKAFCACSVYACKHFEWIA